MKIKPVFAILILISTVSATIYHFTMQVDVKVTKSDITVTPKSFSVDLKSGTTYVRKITIENRGPEKEIYFQSVVEGPDPNAVDVEIHSMDGKSITPSSKLKIEAGSESSPAEVSVNVHVNVDDDAEEGEYTVYVMVKETE